MKSMKRVLAWACAIMMLFGSVSLPGIAEEGEAAPPAEVEQAPQPAESVDRTLQVMRLEMRLADLSARLAKPRKGDHPEELNEQDLQLAEELRKVKQQS